MDKTEIYSDKPVLIFYSLITMILIVIGLYLFLVNMNNEFVNQIVNLIFFSIWLSVFTYSFIFYFLRILTNQPLLIIDNECIKIKNYSLSNSYIIKWQDIDKIKTINNSIYNSGIQINLKNISVESFIIKTLPLKGYNRKNLFNLLNSYYEEYINASK